MTEMQIIIILDIIIALNVFIQAIWLLIWLGDRKEDKTNILLTELSKKLTEINLQQLEQQEQLEKIQYSSFLNAKNTRK